MVCFLGGESEDEAPQDEQIENETQESDEESSEIEEHQNVQQNEAGSVDSDSVSPLPLLARSDFGSLSTKLMVPQCMPPKLSSFLQTCALPCLITSLSFLKIRASSIFLSKTHVGV